MTTHYCDITNLSGSDRSREHSLTHPLQYKSLVIGLLLCRQVCLAEPWEEPVQGIRLTLSEWLRYVDPGETAAHSS